MENTYEGETYRIVAEPCHLLPDDEVKVHHYHYANGQKQFQRWITDFLHHKGEVKLNFFLTLAKRFSATDGTLPEEALYNLQRWLRGRQFCYCHHLHKGDADEGHLHPIHIARQLIQLLRPRDSADMIARCTPDNLFAMVKAQGSAKAREIYNCSRPEDVTCRTRSPSPAEYEEKCRRMSQQSWRRTSDSSSVSSSDESRGRSCSFSSSTSLSSLGSWTSRNTSPAKTRSTWASRVVTQTQHDLADAQQVAPVSTSSRKILVLKTQRARDQSTSP